MSLKIAMRPRFVLQVALPCDEVFAHFEAALEAGHGRVIRAEYYWGKQIELRIQRAQQRVWTPELKLFVEGTAQDSTLLLGRFGPDGHVWTLFMAMYALCALVAFGGVMVLSSQLMVRGGGTWGAWLIFAGAFGAALVYALALLGQQLAHEHIARLEDLVHAALPDDVCQWREP